MTLPDKSLSWPIAWAAVEEIARSESCRLTAYRCPAGVPTIGWGRTRGVRMGDTCTQAQADRWLLEDIAEAAEGVRSKLARDASPNELGAMVSLAYNIGHQGFARSTVLRQHNAGDFQSAARAFALWNKSGGRALSGLTARRAREAALYLTPDSDDPLPMPQSVEAESGLARSPIAVSGGLSIAAALAALVGQDSEQAAAVAAALGVDPVFGVVIVAAWSGAVAVYNRIKQRRQGWA